MWYVVDGAQRLAALYNSIYIGNKAFNFQFDPETEEFTVDAKPDKSRRLVVLPSLHSPAESSEVQSWASALSLTDAVNKLHDSFANYMIPVQMLANASLQDTLSIYEVINLSGQRLSKTANARSRSP